MQINVVAIEIRCRIYPTAATGTACHVRWGISIDGQPNGLQALVPDILTVNDPTAHRNLQYRKRFKTLVTKDYNVPTVTVGDSAIIRRVHMYVKPRRPIKVEYNIGNAGTVGDISTNNVFFWTIGSNVAGTTQALCAGYIRMRFMDV